ncbi:MAG: hypothetical protein GWN01_08660 [Nitrosopumilaceae archaeon]|nr:hypothetical protein [Nitrosopumilaceae archaeon]NIU85932.1 hypothetical protein [Nitrosopumilaceae archaeon]NIV64761.1 hypothetical protein [Nitrosopumilaceae archaeon]NIX61587.1 hypothetical protein [Nitrosopumilaceae archaeon]
MDISKLNSINGNNINKTNETSEGNASEKTSKSSGNTPKDKVSLGDYQFRNNDQLFAKLELEKLNESSSQQFKEMKAQVSEFLNASEHSAEAAQETELGQKINDPEVWGDIASKILK